MTRQQIGLLTSAGLMLVLLSGCSKESLYRGGYQTLQHHQTEQCRQDYRYECPEQESYDTYKKRLREHKTASR